MDIKLILSVSASLITLTAHYIYIRDIIRGKTKPHTFTWLIWFITSGVAVLGAWKGGGYFSVISMMVITFLVFIVLLLSFKYGTKDKTKSDVFVLFLAFLSIIIWWRTNNPVLAVLLVSIIDGLGYVPTYRKSFHKPYEESLVFWIAGFVEYALILLSNKEYNILTVSYVLTVALSSFVLIGILIFRRRIIKNKSL